MRIIRVFPRRTKATPDDELAFVGDPPLLRPEADEVHVSCTFTWDLPEAIRLVLAWTRYYPTKLGGPACGSMPCEFTPGRYLRPGCVITTRGCPNHCDYCFVPQREGPLRELTIRNGWNVLDNNLLAASRTHIEAVLHMLAKQKERAMFTGGLEAKRVQPWFAKALKEIRTRSAFLAYDRPSDRIPIKDAAKLLVPCFWKRRIGCYVLCGYMGDSIEDATERCQYVQNLDMRAFPMYYRPAQKHLPPAKDWKKFLRSYNRGIPVKSPVNQRGSETAEFLL